MAHEAYLSITFALWLLVGVAHAQPSQPSAAQASPSAGDVAIQKGREGVALFERGQWRESLALFREADALFHSPVLTLYSARAERNLGNLVEAAELYRALARETIREDSPAIWAKAQSDGAAELAELEADIPSLTVALLGASKSAAVSVDGRSVEVGAPARLNPGAHRVVAVDGARTLTRSVTLTRGQPIQTVTLDLRVPASPALPVSVPSSDGWQNFGIVLTVVGGASLVAGGVLGGIALEEAAAAEARLPVTCTSDGRCLSKDRTAVEESYASSQTFAAVSDGLLIGGGVLAATGIILLIVDPDGGSTVSAAARRDAMSLRLRF